MRIGGLSTAALAAALLLGGCMGMGGAEQTVALTPSSEVPAAQGKVDVRSAKNGNTDVNVRVEHMAPPERISKDATSYVVWVKPLEGDRPAQNMGAIRVDKDLKGDLKTVTPLKTFDLFVTAEANASAAKPSGKPILQTRVSQP